ncbi:MAG: alpha-L-fucosidase [Gemmiger sp.]|nr:alpha-L-fucosidase [Gemmiger sp.]
MPETEQERIIAAAHITPSPRQYAWQALEFYAFVHFGITTFTNREWGDGTEDPALFAPTALDAGQWVAAIKSAGMKGLILTCKHHDGFCLWPSAYTRHSVRYSPWKNGKGDVVREVAQACAAAGLAFGVYLSPWDRHEPSYGTGDAYNRYYLAQLHELATNYGKIFCFWFDGACGEGKNGKKQVYDWDAYYQEIRRCQPDAVINVCGPDVRWCGNEAGKGRKSEWSVVPATLRDNERVAAKSQQTAGAAFARQVSTEDEDLGSRAAIRGAGALAWYPAEVDTSLRPGWFYHPEEDTQVRTTAELFEIYCGSVGANASLLLNIPPNTAGLLAPPDVGVLGAFGTLLAQKFAWDQAPGAVVTATSADARHPVAEALAPGRARFWKAAPGVAQAAITLQFAAPASVSCLVLGEDLLTGQRIEAGELLADGKRVATFTVVGNKRICNFAPVRATTLTLRILESRCEPTLCRLSVY